MNNIFSGAVRAAVTELGFVRAQIDCRGRRCAELGDTCLALKGSQRRALLKSWQLLQRRIRLRAGRLRGTAGENVAGPR